MSKRLVVRAETPLERAVLRWINAEARERESGAAGVLDDLFQGGCASGMVGHLIYYSDTLPFYRRHREEIGALLAEIAGDLGAEGPGGVLRDWDPADPLAQDTQNQNLLAWFGFEETARRLADRAGLEV